MAPRNIEAMHVLSPSQRGMLFESVATQGSGRFVEHSAWEWQGPLDVAAYQQAWRELLRRHSALRTCFAWREKGEPLQVIAKEVPFSVAEQDWRALSPEERQARLRTHLADAWREGFELNKPPLLRVSALRVEDERTWIVWSYHHVLMDGWCLPILLRELDALYEAARKGRDAQLPPARPFHDYITWLKRRDPSTSQAFWKERLHGLDAPTPLGVPRPAELSSTAEDFGQVSGSIPEAQAARLQAAARRAGTTPGAVVQAAWALLLSRFSGRDDVAFGATVAGRPPELAGVESMVGLFINTIPVRVRVPAEGSFGTLLQGVHAWHSAAVEHQHCSAGQIQSWSEVPAGRELFQSLVVFENYPLQDQVIGGAGARLRVLEAGFQGTRTRYPLTLLIVPVDGLQLRLVHDRARVDDAAASAVLENLKVALATAAAEEDVSLSALRRALEALPVPHVAEPVTAVEEVREEKPRGAIEELVAESFRALLGLPKTPGADASFLELGGHSLVATQLQSRLRDVFRVELPLRALFETPTVRGIAARVERARGPEATAGKPPLVKRERGELSPPSFAQQRLWFLDRLTPGNSFYTMSGGLLLRGELDEAALTRALREIVRRHEVLRTCFVERDGTPFQRVLPEVTVPLPRVDLRALPETERRAAAQQHVLDGVRQPFALDQAPLFRAHLLQLGDQEHILLMIAHHIISDGWSTGIFAQELLALYGAFTRSEASPLPELTAQYADFALWQREWLQGPALDGLLAYWKQQLADLPTLALATDKPRPSVQSFRGATEQLHIPAEVVSRLRTLGLEENATLFMTMLAAFQVLLFRYTGQEDVVVGTPVAGRNLSGLEGLLGFFVNTLPLRTSLAGGPTFRELLRRVRDTALDAYAHQDLPFERLVEELRPERHLAMNPLFQVLFALQNAPMRLEGGPELTLTMLDQEIGTTRFDLELHALEDVGGVTCSLSFSTDLFHRESARRMLTHFQALLTAIGQTPDAALLDLHLEDPAQTQALLSLAGFSTPYPRDRSLADLFEEQVRLRPDSPALRWDEGVLTYRQLHEKASRLASSLAARGVGPDVLVGVLEERSPELILGMLGVILAGGAYVPLDPAHPRERLAAVVERAKIRVIVEGLGAPKGELCPHVPRVPVYAPETIALLSAEHPRPSPRHLAYVLFTSGSTGEPKGVCVEQRSVVRLIRDTDFIHPRPEDVFFQFCPSTFDVSTMEIWGPLLTGGCLAFPPRGRLSLEELGASIRRQGVTILWLTSGLFSQMVRERLDDLRGLHTLLAGGDVVDPEDAATALRGLPGVTLINGYGPTENTTFTSCHTMRSVSELDGGSIPIGKPIANGRTYVLDAAQRMLPVGVPGELYAGGDGVARGYLNDPVATARQFVPDPWGEPGSRMYRTGDRVRWRADGTLEFFGRIDRQVKIRGVRVEPGEIESVLLAHPAVREAVVNVYRHGEDRRLAAYVVCRPEAATSPQGERPPAEALVGDWQRLYDETYAEPPNPEAGDFIGWVSSYTGEPIPRAEMEEWLADTLRRLERRAPARVLDIGCGVGLVLFGLAPRCQLYHALDFSETALAHVASRLKDAPLPQVRLERRRADQLDGIPHQGFDLVVLNSVIQYFPSIDYLIQVLEQAVLRTADGGAVVIGDVRNFALLEAFHASVVLTRSPESLSREELRSRIRRAIEQEEELTVAPAFFEALRARIPRIRRVQVELKHGRADNELSGFRYAVTLEVGPPERLAEPPTQVAWGEGCSDLTQLARRVETTAHLRVTGIPNSRVQRWAEALALLSDPRGPQDCGELRRRLAARSDGGALHPDSLRELAGSFGRQATVTWSRTGPAGTMDIDLSPSTNTNALPERPPPPLPASWQPFANVPVQARFARQLVPELRAHLESRLPPQLIPNAILVLDALPLTPVGKVDRRALPSPEPRREHRPFGEQPPRNDTERRIAEIWARVLGVERVGIGDDFFALGGHSLLATQIVSRIRDALGVDLPLRCVFEAPSVEKLAAEVTRRTEARAAAPQQAPPLVQVPRQARGRREAK
ncbi:non-ribosomal peptide synthetase [Hyalangium gracile]|uniref:non-ribosomal peptide synthetase n=1 Tax=Hyalangium gracile TaxID=394092 RepID=UPI001CCE3E7A|nr:non-ribosomal peptide synthetase [Hyalangium gracile]